MARRRATTSQAAEAALRRRFEELKRDWLFATQALSSMSKIYSHPDYQQIIGLGPEVLPLLFQELRRDPVGTHAR